MKIAMKKTILIVPLLALVVLVSGCSFLGQGGLFGSDVINVQTRSIEESGKDPLVIKNIMSIPTSPVLPDQEVYLSFIVENTNKVYTVNDVRVDLFNAPGFRNSASLVPCNSGINTCLPDIGPNGIVECTNQNPCNILPGEQRLIQFTLRAPTKEQISSIKTQARLDFKVLYDFSSSMNFVIPAINKQEVLKRMREGGQVDLKFDKSFSAGPVRLDVTPLGVNYILDNLETVLLFNLQNVGSGNLQNSAIPVFGSSNIPGANVISVQGISINFPQGIIVPDTTQGTLATIFSGPADETDNSKSYTNKIQIQLYKGQSQTSMRFPVKLDPSQFQIMQDNQIPYRSFEIKTTAYYTYELRNGVDIVINPFENT